MQHQCHICGAAFSSHRGHLAPALWGPEPTTQQSCKPGTSADGTGAELYGVRLPSTNKKKIGAVLVETLAMKLSGEVHVGHAALGRG